VVSHKQKERIKERKITEVYKLLFNSQVKIASKAFVKKRNLAQEEQQLQFANQTIKKTIEFVDPYVVKGKD